MHALAGILAFLPLNRYVCIWSCEEKDFFNCSIIQQIQTVLFIAFLMRTKIGDPKSQRVKNENPRKRPREPPNSDTKDSKSYI